MKRRDVETLRATLALPTAPFREHAVIEYVRRFAADTGVRFARDAGGNVLLRHRRAGGAGRWVFAAHMDHPGFVATARRGRTLWAQFRGSVGKEYFVGSSVRFFAPGGERRAVVESVRAMTSPRWLAVRLKLDRSAPVPPGTVGMWDMPAVRIRAKRVSARACDDLAGVAVVLCVMRRLAEEGIEADVTGLLTRAEEAGFVGALAACKSNSFPRRARVVAIEASQAQPEAPLGGGAIIRVGDSVRTFDPALTAHMVAVASELAADGLAGFRRCLMPGGTCESTVYQAFGRCAAAVCLPLDNYHNRGKGAQIAPERIHLDDFHSLVALLVHLARSSQSPAAVEAELAWKLDKRFDALGGYLND